MWLARAYLGARQPIWAVSSSIWKPGSTSAQMAPGDTTVGRTPNSLARAAGDPLPEVQREAENGLEFARRARFGLAIDIVTPQLGLIRTLRGLTPKFGFQGAVIFQKIRDTGRPKRVRRIVRRQSSLF
jgi:hypothetical protein